MFKKIIIFSGLIALSACAYVIDKDFQELTVRTPGAKNAVCNVNSDKINYKFYPPQTRNIRKSKQDLIIDCLAPGNRERKVVIRPAIEKSFYGNVANGVVPGGAVDLTSQAMFTYPDTIEVDFSHSIPKPMPLPAHNYEDTLQPDSYYLEEFRATTPAMNSDRFEKPIPLLRRVPQGNASDFGDQSTNARHGDKGDLMRVMNTLDLQPTTQSDAVLPENDAGLPSSVSASDALPVEQNVDTPNDPVPLIP